MNCILIPTLQKADTNLNEIRATIVEKKLEVLKKSNDDCELLQMLDIMDAISSSMVGMHTSNAKRSELSFYRQFATILDVMFRGTTFDIKEFVFFKGNVLIKTKTFCANSGEQCSDATKVARKYNQSLCKDFDNKNTVGRKIDLLIGTLNMDISSSEWKKEKIAPSLVVDQQVKNARTNKCILKAIRELLVHDEPFVLGMDWIGKSDIIPINQSTSN